MQGNNKNKKEVIFLRGEGWSVPQVRTGLELPRQPSPHFFIKGGHDGTGGNRGNSLVGTFSNTPYKGARKRARRRSKKGDKKCIPQS